MSVVMSECLNRAWVAANPGQSLEWARGMWWCPCSECERPERVSR